MAAGEDPTGPERVAGRLGTVARPDGARQVTLDDKPLCTFTPDQDAGKAAGNGVSDTFDGTTFRWQVAGPGGTEPPAGDPGSGY